MLNLVIRKKIFIIWFHIWIINFFKFYLWWFFGEAYKVINFFGLLGARCAPNRSKKLSSKIRKGCLSGIQNNDLDPTSKFICYQEFTGPRLSKILCFFDPLPLEGSCGDPPTPTHKKKKKNLGGQKKKKKNFFKKIPISLRHSE